ncbi:MAG TPA: MarR family transcriptional regulator [Actinomycetota bacterium]|nr:MarR family transcriptional regulator [Actinomycetota bacterium]
MSDDHPEELVEAFQDVARLSVAITAVVLARVEKGLGVRLTFPQYRTLVVLSDGSKAPSELAEIIGVSRPAITKVARSLNSRGLIRRSAEGSDRRMALLSLTGKGAELVEQVRRERAARFRVIVRDLSDHEAMRLLESLEHLKGTLSQAITPEESTQLGTRL